MPRPHADAASAVRAPCKGGLDRASAESVSPTRLPGCSGQPLEAVPAKPVLVDLNALPPVACPCGVARRAFADREEFPGTVHLTQISQDAQEHFHREHTEVYVILECEADAAIFLDGVRHPVTPRTAILIPPGVRHRACGKMTVLILCSPNFDPEDEHF